MGRPTAGPAAEYRDSRYTLTAVGHRIYARMGQSSNFFPAGRRQFLDDRAGDQLDRGPGLEHPGQAALGSAVGEPRAPNRPGAGRSTINFEGTPVADARNVYAAVTDRGQQTMMYVACFDAETGNRRWVRYLGTATREFPIT